jgi:hypothetical protein
VHQQHLRTPGNIRVHGNGKDEFVIFAVAVIELITPKVLDISRVHKAVAVGRILDEHHGWQVIEVPTGRDLYKSSLLALDERLHPLFGRLFVVNLGPRIASPEIVGLAVVVAHAVVILDTVIEEELCTFATGLPPMSPSS